MILLKKFIRMRVLFVIRKARENKAGKCPVNCRITVDGVQASEFSTGVSVDTKKWDSKLQRVKGSGSKMFDENRHFEIIKSELDEIYLAARAKGKRLSADDVKDIYTGKKAVNNTLQSIVDMYVKELKAKGRSKVTIFKYRKAFEYLRDFLKKDMPIEHIEKRHVSGFWVWLKEKDFKNDYCNKITQACIGLFRYGIRDGYIEVNPFSGVSLEWTREFDTTHLDKREVLLLKNSFMTEKLRKVADSFLFMCHTGLHISDYISAVEESRYFVGSVEFMKIKRIKTNVEAKFPLHSYAKYLLQKYGGLDKLPRISGQKSNDYLKLISECVGIDKVLTNKIARKTFTNMALNDYKMSMEAVSKMLGHTTTNQIKHYGTVSEDRIYAEWGEKGKIPNIA